MLSGDFQGGVRTDLVYNWDGSSTLTFRSGGVCVAVFIPQGIRSTSIFVDCVGGTPPYEGYMERLRASKAEK